MKKFTIRLTFGAIINFLTKHNLKFSTVDLHAYASCHDHDARPVPFGDLDRTCSVPLWTSSTRFLFVVNDDLGSKTKKHKLKWKLEMSLDVIRNKKQQIMFISKRVFGLRWTSEPTVNNRKSERQRISPFSGRAQLESHHNGQRHSEQRTRKRAINQSKLIELKRKLKKWKFSKASKTRQNRVQIDLIFY